VLDIDASIKPLYGRQEGAEIGYNPAKPMRPSHVLRRVALRLTVVFHSRSDVGGLEAVLLAKSRRVVGRS
jgi:hypothetical protein